MKKIYSLIFFVFCAFATVNSQAPAASNAIMLQGFFWDSNSSTSWNQLYAISGEISGYFDYVWLPPSAFSSGGTGYLPRQWSNQNSAWGSESQLKQLISYMKAHGCKSIADIVVNHRDNMSTWCDFYPDNFGDYGSFQFSAAQICQDDEVNTNTSAGSCYGTATGANDTGENYATARDLDHTQSYVQNAIKAYMQFMKNEMGYSGWRYDMAKGFGAQYIGEYSDAAGGEISVGEYFDGDYNALWNWLQGTSYKSMAFDFALKFSALNNGLSSNNYANMTWWDASTSKYRPAGLVHSPQSRRYGVTFVENHDTQVRATDNCGCNYTGNIPQAYAFIMSSPGIPCVFYPHWMDYKTQIQAMMKARKAVGLNSESDVEVQNTAGYYKAYSIGTCGTMLTYIGNTSDNPGSEWTLAASGGSGVTNYKIYINVTNTSCQTEYQNKIDAGVNPEPNPTFNSITLTALVPADWTTPRVYVWNTAGGEISSTWPGNVMTNEEANKYSLTLTGFSASEVGVVFNNGSNVKQTVDLFATENTCWTIENTPTAGGGKYSAAVDEMCQASSAVNNVETNKFSIYPNPADFQLNIFNFQSNGNQKPQILDVTGKIISNPSIINNSIDISNLSSGIYFVKIGNQVEKFVKK